MVVIVHTTQQDLGVQEIEASTMTQSCGKPLVGIGNILAVD